VFDEELLKANTASLERIVGILDQRLPSAIKKGAQETEKAVKNTESWIESAKGLADTFNEVTGALEKVGGYVEKFADMAGAAEQNQRAVEAFGDSLDKIKTQTAGAVSNLDLLADRNKLLESGLRLTNDEFAVFAREAHDHAAKLGTDAKGELDKLTEALRSGSGEALRQYGVKVKEGSTRAQAFEATLKHLRAEQTKAGPVTKTMKDNVDALKVGWNEATTAIVGAIAKLINLQGILSAITKGMRDLVRDVGQLTSNDAAGRAASQAGIAQPTVMQRLGLSSNTQALTASIRADMRQEIANLQAKVQDAGRATGTGFYLGDTNRLNDRQLQEAIGAMRTLAERTSGTFLSRAQGERVDPNTARAIILETQASMHSRFDELARVEQANRAANDRVRTEALVANGLPSTVAAANARGLTGSGPGIVGPRDTTNGRGGGGPTASELREMREKLADLERQRIVDRAQQALTAAGASAASQQLGTDIAGVNALGQTQAQLLRITLQESAELSGIATKLQGHNLTLKQRVELEERARTLRANRRTTEQVMLAIGERERDLKEASFNLTVQQTTQEVALYQQAIASREAGLRLTASETEALASKTTATQRLRELEQGLSGSISTAQWEVQFAATQEAKNAALQRELQLRMQLAGVQSQIRAADDKAKEDALKGDFGAQISKKFLGNVADTTTQAQRFAGVAVDAFNQLGEGFASNIVAVIQGQKSFGEAMRDMLRDFLGAMTKMAVLEVIKNTAMGFAALATYQYPSAAQHFTSAAIWGGIGIASGAALAGVSAASKPAATPPASSGAGGGSPRAANNGGGAGGASGGGGGFTLNVNVSGALFNAGVATAAAGAVEYARNSGLWPAYRARRAMA